MKKLITLLTIITFLVGCGGIGKSARHIEPVKSTDTTLECKQIKMEIDSIYSDFQIQDKNVDGVVLYNSVLGFLGGLFILPLFAMDISNTEMKECDQLANRYNNLIKYGDEKQCGFNYQPLEKTGTIGGWKLKGSQNEVK